MWIFIPYAEVGYLTMKYGKYFEKEYAQSSWFDEEPYMSVKVFRYKDEKARVYLIQNLLKRIWKIREKILQLYVMECYTLWCFSMTEENGWIIEGEAANEKDFSIYY